MADSDSRRQEPAGDSSQLAGTEEAAAGNLTGVADFTDPLGMTTGMIHGSASDAQVHPGE
ncbi:MAG: hypothetical protein JWN30_616, partial [Bacilli bacterium]|nr:hypothetical protein [Bacilli bacterium]